MTSGSSHNHAFNVKYSAKRKEVLTALTISAFFLSRFSAINGDMEMEMEWNTYFYKVFTIIRAVYSYCRSNRARADCYGRFCNAW